VGLTSGRIEAVERRFVLVREQLRQSRESPGSKPIDVPGDTPRVFVTDCTGPDEVIWRDHNRRAGMEDRIPELRRDPSAHGFCMKEFFAPEAVFRPVLQRFNLLAEFQRAVGLLDHRAGDDPYPGADLRCRLRSCRPSSGCPTGAKLGRLEHRYPFAGPHLGLANPNFAEFGFRVRNWTPPASRAAIQGPQKSR
jgi:hypothetical protein